MARIQKGGNPAERLLSADSISVRNVLERLDSLAKQPIDAMGLNERRALLNQIEEEIQMQAYADAPRLLAMCRRRLGFSAHTHPLFLQELSSHEILIADSADAYRAGTKAGVEADRLGFAAPEIVLIAQCARILAENLPKHAHGGRALITILFSDLGLGLEFRTIDQGPGLAATTIAEIAASTQRDDDGALRGLSFVKRHAQSFSIRNSHSRTTEITCQFWLLA